jgi:hypothetical protein
MKFTTLGFLTFVLWTTFTVSLISIPLKVWMDEYDRIAEYKSEVAGGTQAGSDARYF